MVYHIKELIIEKNLIKHNSDEDKDLPNFIFNENKSLKDLSKINIFVGSNNSGKSLFLRTLSTLDKYKFVPQNTNLLVKYNKLMDYFHSPFAYDLDSQFDSSLSDIQINHLEKIKHNFNRINFFTSSENIFPYENSSDIVSLLLEQEPDYDNFPDYEDDEYIERQYIDRLNQNITLRVDNIIESLNKEFDIKKYEFKRIYIPTLRGLRNPSIENTLDFYKIRTQFDYFNDKDKVTEELKLNDLLSEKYKLEIFTGLNLYEEVKRLLLGNLSQRKEIRNFENFLSKNFFDNKDISLIPEYKSDVLSIKIGDEKERPIYELGDGIQSVIVMTFPLFKYPNENLLIFIEEPELFLHAGMQKTLMKTLINSEYFDNCQFFLVSHSNHVIDSINESDDISIYSVKKQLPEEDSDEKIPNFKIENLGHGNKNALTLLGVNSSSVYLSNCTIWVEGITDKLYLSKYLEVYLNNLTEEQSKKYNLNQLKEGLNYSFAFSGGTSISYLSFNDEELESNEKILVKRLCSKSMVIVDNDNGKSSELKESIKQSLGNDNFIELPVIEIENLLPLEVIKKVVSSYPTTEALTDNDFEEIDNELLETIRLGTLIEKHLLSKYTKDRKHFLSNKNLEKIKLAVINSKIKDNITVENKAEFCKMSLPHITFDNMTQHSKNVVEKILDFISANN